MAICALGLVGLGKIASDQHLPAIAASADFHLKAIASPGVRHESIACFNEIEAMIADAKIDAITICTPPVGRYALAKTALEAGFPVMLEKPPGATITEVQALAALAKAKGVPLMTSWHSREAPGVATAKAWLEGRTIHAVRIEWRENVYRSHPGQEWIMSAGGYGVFDPGINGLSIATHILPDPLIVQSGVLDVPEGRQAPIAGKLSLSCGDAPVSFALDFLREEQQVHMIEVDTDAGTLRMDDGGDILTLPDGPVPFGEEREYPRLYAAFADLLARGESDVDLAPMQVVEDAFFLCERKQVAPFSF